MSSMQGWQDVMIENFGSNWAKTSYSLVEIGKLAEKITLLEARLIIAKSIIEKLEKVMGFYGDPRSWLYPGNNYHDFNIANIDIGECVWIAKTGRQMKGRKAGKLARSTLSEVQKLKEGLNQMEKA